MNFFKKVKLRRLQEAITSNGKPLSPNPENPKKEDDLEIPDFSKVGDIEPSKDTNSAQAPQPTTTPEANPEGNQPQDNPEAEDPNAEGENPEGEEQPQDDDGLGDMSEEQPQDEAPADDVTPGADDELKQAEVDLFSKLTPAQIQVKNTELKSQFVKTYISITYTLGVRRINGCGTVGSTLHGYGIAALRYAALVNHYISISVSQLYAIRTGSCLCHNHRLRTERYIYRISARQTVITILRAAEYAVIDISRYLCVWIACACALQLPQSITLL